MCHCATHLTTPLWCSPCVRHVVPSERHSNYDIINDPISVWIWPSQPLPSHLHQTLNYFLLSLHFQIHHHTKTKLSPTFIHYYLTRRIFLQPTKRKLLFTLAPCVCSEGPVVKLDLQSQFHLHKNIKRETETFSFFIKLKHKTPANWKSHRRDHQPMIKVLFLTSYFLRIYPLVSNDTNLQPASCLASAGEKCNNSISQ